MDDLFGALNRVRDIPFNVARMLIAQSCAHRNGAMARRHRLHQTHFNRESDDDDHYGNDDQENDDADDDERFDLVMREGSTNYTI